jgi:hypothetical protein
MKTLLLVVAAATVLLGAALALLRARGRTSADAHEVAGRVEPSLAEVPLEAPPRQRREPRLESTASLGANAPER